MSVLLWICGLVSLLCALVWFDVSTGAMHEATAVLFLLVSAVCIVGATINNAVNRLTEKVEGGDEPQAE